MQPVQPVEAYVGRHDAAEEIMRAKPVYEIRIFQRIVKGYTTRTRRNACV